MPPRRARRNRLKVEASLGCKYRSSSLIYTLLCGVHISPPSQCLTFEFSIEDEQALMCQFITSQNNLSPVQGSIHLSMKQKKKPLNNSKVWSNTADNLTTPWWGTACGGREHTASSLGPTHLLEVQSEEAFIKSHVVISPTLLFVIHFSSPKNQVAVSSENACLWLNLPVWNFTLWWSCSSEVSNAIRHVCPFLFFKCAVGVWD